MKHLIRLALALLAALLLTGFVSAQEPDEAAEPGQTMAVSFAVTQPEEDEQPQAVSLSVSKPDETPEPAAVELSFHAAAEPKEKAALPPEILRETETLERLWDARLEDAACRFSVRIDDRGATVFEQSGIGWLDCSWRFADTDWTAFRWLWGQPGAETESCVNWAFDPFGDGATLRVRCFLVLEDGRRHACVTEEITSREGVLLHRSTGSWPVDGSFGGASYIFESVCEPTEPAPKEAELVSLANPEPAGEERARCWTYTSSDGRALWSVELTGVFRDGRCVDAFGDVTVLDGDWDCETAVFAPDGPDAAARVVMRRRTLGVWVARREYEFILPGAE